jgi:CheY-like chemotaxis protein
MPAHILVVEDDADQRSDLAEIIKSLGYQLNNAQAHFHFGQVCNEACGHVLLLLAASRLF